MSYLRESQLFNAYKRSFSSLTSMRKSFSESYIKPEANIFLSHSHLDKNLIIGFIQTLKELEIYVYVDWNDGEMPEYTNRTTALRIKKRIKQSDFFMLFATENAMKSRWVPWEIGVADQAKRYDRIFIIPVKRDNVAYSGNEYLQLYNSILISNDNNLAGFKPRQYNSGEYLESIVNRKRRIYG